MKVFLYSCDGTGNDSIADVVEEFKTDLIVKQINHYSQFDDSIRKILPKLKPEDIVVVDPLNSLTARVRGDVKLGEDWDVSYWDLRQKYIGDKDNWGAYTAAANLVMRRLQDVRNVGAKVITITHEAEKKDDTVVPPVKKRAPDLNPELLTQIVASSSTICRLSRQYEDLIGREGEVVLKSGARVLQIHPTEEAIAKYHVSLKKARDIKQFISRPSLPKLWNHLGTHPSWLTVYGAPGTGKTTFAVSMFLDPQGNGIGD